MTSGQYCYSVFDSYDQLAARTHKIWLLPTGREQSSEISWLHPLLTSTHVLLVRSNETPGKTGFQRCSEPLQQQTSAELRGRGFTPMPIATARPIGHRPRKKPVWRSREAFLADAGLFTIGTAGLYSANLVGSLPGGEILLFPLLPVALLDRGRRAFDRRYLWFYILVGAWLLGTIVADAYNGSGPENRMKGTARVVFFTLDFIALAILLNKRTNRIVIFALSIVAVMFIGSWQFRPNFNVQWKFGMSEGLASWACWSPPTSMLSEDTQSAYLIVLVLAV